MSYRYLVPMYWQRQACGSPARQRPAAVNVRENAQEYVVEAEMPGLSQADITVSVDRGMLSLVGERQPEAAANDGATARSHSRFERALRLPDGVQAEAIVANLKHGVLTVTVPKAPVLDTSKRIPVVAG